MNIIDIAMENTENKLVTWLIEELAARKRSQRWLARESGLSHSAVANILSGYQPPTWGFCAAVAGGLGEHPLKLFRIAGLLTEDSPGENEPALLHLYRQLTPSNQQSALAMLRGLAGQTAPATAPAPGADIDAVCRLLGRLDSTRLEMAAIFIKWLTGQPPVREASEPTWQDVEVALASLDSEKRETVLTNLIRKYGQGRNPGVAEDSHSESDPGPGQVLGQGTLF